MSGGALSKLRTSRPQPFDGRGRERMITHREPGRRPKKTQPFHTQAQAKPFHRGRREDDNWGHTIGGGRGGRGGRRGATIHTYIYIYIYFFLFIYLFAYLFIYNMA